MQVISATGRFSSLFYEKKKLLYNLLQKFYLWGCKAAGLSLNGPIFPFHAKQSFDYAEDVDISKLWAATSGQMAPMFT